MEVFKNLLCTVKLLDNLLQLLADQNHKKRFRIEEPNIELNWYEIIFLQSRKLIFLQKKKRIGTSICSSINQY